MYDFLIINAQVYTGLPDPPEQTRVAVLGDRIAAVGPELSPADAREVVDAGGLILGPGFIDPHASTGFGFFFPQAADHKIFQGITTEIFGNCGTSTAPVGAHLVSTMERLSKQIGFPFEWRSMEEYMAQVQDKLPFNIATLVGHSTLRAGHLKEWKSLQPGELEAMKTALAQAMDEGALGLSTGLIYAPGTFAKTEEIIELAKVVRDKGGIYASHIRDERDEIESAVEEALAIGEAAQVPVLISHLKAAEKQNWGKIPKLLKRIEQYNDSGQRGAAVDVYPYTAVSTKLRAFIPKHFLQDGIAALADKMKTPAAEAAIAAWIRTKGYDLGNMLIISNDLPRFYGKTVQEVAQAFGWSEARAIAEMLQESTEVWVVYHCIDEADMDAAVLWPKSMICTDSWSYPINAPTVIGQPHPRSYGAFTTFLERYVLQKKWLKFEEAFYKASYLPAQFFQLEKRGAVRPGYYADLILLEPEAIKANATYLEPRRLSSGTVRVWINGQCVLKDGVIQPITPGQILSLNHVSSTSN